jgi:hypothetical protein
VEIHSKSKCQSPNVSDKEREDGQLEIQWRLLEIHGDTGDAAERLGIGDWRLQAVCRRLTRSDWLGTGDRVH